MKTGTRTKKTYKYPWQVWLDGEEHTIYQGKDYSADIDPLSLRRLIYQRAREKGQSCKGRIDYINKSITFQVVEGEKRSYHRDGLCSGCRIRPKSYSSSSLCRECLRTRQIHINDEERALLIEAIRSHQDMHAGEDLDKIQEKLDALLRKLGEGLVDG